MNLQEPKKGFNLSKWALEHVALTRYLMLVLMVLLLVALFRFLQAVLRRVAVWFGAVPAV